MSEVRVSIVMPCYQSAATVERCVRSVQAQTVTYWELIAVDDGSTDGTLAALRALAAGEPRMRIIHQENGGVSAARNAGMAAARGEWLFFIDADDWLRADALRKLLALADEGTDIVCGAYVMRYADEGGREAVSTCAHGDLQTVLESLIRGDSALNSMCARLYRADMLRRAGVRAPEGVKIGEDVLFNLDAFMAARAWRMTDEVIYVYELGGDSAMTRAKKGIYADSVPMITGIGQFIAQHGVQTELFRAHIDIYVRTLRADRGRLRAALGMTYAMTANITRGVDFGALDAKQKLYYLALRLLPVSSILLP